MGCSSCAHRKGSSCTAPTPDSVRIVEMTEVGDEDGVGCPVFLPVEGQQPKVRAKSCKSCESLRSRIAEFQSASRSAADALYKGSEKVSGEIASLADEVMAILEESHKEG